MLEGETLFSGHDPAAEKYRGRAHLAEMIALLGHPPEAFLARTNFRSEFYSENSSRSDIAVLKKAVHSH